VAKGGGKFLGDFDTAAVMDRTMAVRPDESTAGQIVAAVCFVHRNAADDSDELALLQALGLAPDISAHRVRLSQTPEYRREAYAKTHPRNAGPNWVAPDHTALCGCHTCCNRRAVQRARARGAEDPTLIPHGTPSGYDYWGCRCDDCSDVNTRAGREEREKRRERREARRAAGFTDGGVKRGQGFEEEK
jgi:hypothetical protein